ncbi:hypothetical protein CALCODRAFT_509448 [Calocera cornea HHB12733]|uniref:Uncharacterized protein n=1 Tax=Calocera cornea HHB12733 TaxID=1353952 RepID=A0A165FAP4_9BASI|nr:hypothetical protein CALCODRAFT_509448 [Calocera cornea HHB12733]
MQPFRPDRFRFSLPPQNPPDREQPAAGQPDVEQPQPDASYTGDYPMDDDPDDYDPRAVSPPARAPTTIPPGHRSPEEDLPPVIYPAPVYTYNLRPLPRRTSSRPAGQPEPNAYPGPQRDQGEAEVPVDPALEPASHVAGESPMQQAPRPQAAGPSRREWAFNLRDSDGATSTAPTEPRAHRQPPPTEPRAHRQSAPEPASARPAPATPAPHPPALQPAQHTAVRPAAAPAHRASQTVPPATMEEPRTVDGEPSVRLLDFNEWDHLTRAWTGGPWTLDWWPEGLPFTQPEQWATRHFWSGELHLDFNEPNKEDPWIPCLHCKKAHWFISTQKNPGERFYKCLYNRHPEDCRMFSYKGPLMRDGKLKLGTIVFPPGEEPDRYPPANLIVCPPERIDPRIEYLRDMRNRQNQRRYNEIQESYRQARADGDRVRAEYEAKQEAAKQEAAKQEAAKQAAAKQEAAQQAAGRQEAARQAAARQAAARQEQAAQAAAVRPAPAVPEPTVGPEHYDPGESPLPDTGAASANPSRPPASPTPYRPPGQQSRIAPALRRTNTASFARTYTSLTGQPYPRDTSHDLVPTAGQPRRQPTPMSTSRQPTPMPHPQQKPGSRIPTPVLRQPGSRIPTPTLRQPGARLPTPIPRIPTPLPPLIPMPPPSARQPARASPALQPVTASLRVEEVAPAAPARRWRGPSTSADPAIPIKLDKGKGKMAEKRPAEGEPEGAPPARRPRQGSVSSQSALADHHYWPIGTAPDPENLRRDLAALASTGGPQTRLTMLHLMAGILSDPNVGTEELREVLEPVINHAIDQEGVIVQHEEERRVYDERVRREHRAPRD